MKVALLARERATFGETVRTNGIAAGLRREGHVVDVLVMDRKRATAALSPAFIPFSLTKLALLRRHFNLGASRAFAKVWLNGLLNAFYLIPVLRRGGYEILLAETHYAGLCAWLTRPHLDARFYMDFHGIAVEVAAISRRFYEQAARLEKLLVQECDLVISHGDALRDYLLAQHGGGAQRHIVCHNGTEVQAGAAQHRLPLRVIFAGLFARWCRVEDFVEAARLNTDPEIEFFLMGGGENEVALMDYIGKHRVRITCLGYRPRDEALEALKTMQVGVAWYRDELIRQVASPLKPLDYAACGLPVVGLAIGDSCEIFRRYDAGVICSQHDPRSLLAAVSSLKAKERWTAVAQNGLRLVREARTWPAVVAPLNAHLRSLAAAETIDPSESLARSSLNRRRAPDSLHLPV